MSGRYVPGMVALCLAPPVAAVGLLGLGLLTLGVLRTGCPCGGPGAVTGAVTHPGKCVTPGQRLVETDPTPETGRNGPGSSHAAHGAVTAPGKPAGQRAGRGVTH